MWNLEVCNLEVNTALTGHRSKRLAVSYYFRIWCFVTQTTLKALFPDAAGRRSGERTIPQLPSKFQQFKNTITMICGSVPCYRAYFRGSKSRGQSSGGQSGADQ